VACAHYESELTTITDAILERRDLDGEVAEFGCFKGGSTAKLSLACALVEKELLVFDSFRGLPEPEPWDVDHQIERPRQFTAGEYAGTLDEVRSNVSRYGRLDVCHISAGWFQDTLPTLTTPLAVALVDVDLALSTRQVLERAWPLVSPGGIVFVHDATDAKLQEVIRETLNDATELFVPARDEVSRLETKTLAWALR
jgi:O-methyltransferase